MRFAPVGECIYCGAKDGLSDEHIIAYGLGGDHVLPTASCAACAKITSQVELTVLRKQFLEARAQLGLPSRKKSLPDVLPLTVIPEDDAVTVHLPTAQHPTLAIYLLYPLPASLGGSAPPQGITVIGNALFQIGGPPLKEALAAAGADTVSYSNEFVGSHFEMMLAKIAYGFAVAKLGLDAVRDSPLRETILGRRDDCGQWVGTGNFEPPAYPGLHRVELRGSGGWITAHIHLFAGGRTPEYVVVVKRGSPDTRPNVPHGAVEGPLEYSAPGTTSTTDVKLTPRDERRKVP